MGKSLIIKGADFSANGFVKVWNNDFYEPDGRGFMAAVPNNVIGPIYSEGAKVCGIKMSLKPLNIPSGYNVRNLLAGDTLRVVIANKTAPLQATELVAFTITQADLNIGYIIVGFNEVTLTGNEFIGIGPKYPKPSEEEPGFIIPISYDEQGADAIPGKWSNAAGTVINSTYIKGIATFYEV